MGEGGGAPSRGRLSPRFAPPDQPVAAAGHTRVGRRPFAGGIAGAEHALRVRSTTSALDVGAGLGKFFFVEERVVPIALREIPPRILARSMSAKPVRGRESFCVHRARQRLATPDAGSGCWSARLHTTVLPSVADPIAMSRPGAREEVEHSGDRRALFLVPSLAARMMLDRPILGMSVAPTARSPAPEHGSRWRRCGDLLHHGRRLNRTALPGPHASIRSPCAARTWAGGARDGKAHVPLPVARQ